ncbi:hypothetical protein C8J57DRAFT_1327514 [Mycena rebaudengoi]|nr:hypothetical protein C8J57DRAFT_1327514 [Mycena rebaudengoi]
MDSPFKDILNTNIVPSDAECQSIRDLLSGPRRQCADLTEQIAQMQTSLDDLIRDRDELQSFIDAHLALVSPARKLPDDVVREIFVAALPARNCVMSATEPPLLLCNICQAWRALALSTPQLWTSLHIAVPSRSRVEQMTSMVDAWLSRSGVLPLSLSVFVSRSAEPDTDVSLLLEALIRFSARWKEIHFTLPSLQCFEPLSKVSPEHVSMLESVGIKGGHLLFEGLGSVFAFLGAPNLRSASFSPQLSHVYMFLPSSWGRLRHLNVSSEPGSYISPLTALQMLPQCVRLESCVLAIWSTGETLPEALCRMEHMQHLCVTAAGTSDGLFNFFGKLDLPSLRILEYSAQGGIRLAFLPMLSSAHFVESLTILSAPLITDLVAALRLMPMLKELSLAATPPLSLGSVHDELVTALTPVADADDPVVSPLLQRIIMKNVRVLSDGALLKFIQARTGPHLRDIVHLAAVHVHFLRPMEVDILSPLRALLATGLEVTLDYQHTPRPLYSPFEGVELHNADFAHV